MSTEPTPTERQAAMIADLEARLSLASEREFYHTAELARLRAELAGRDAEYMRGAKMVAESAAVWQDRAERAEAQLAAARKDSQRFNLLATLLEDVNMGDIDPTKHRTEDNEWPDAWRDAIDATAEHAKEAAP